MLSKIVKKINILNLDLKLFISSAKKAVIPDFEAFSC